MNKSPNRNKLGKRIARGIWEDKDGNVHYYYSLPELLALFKIEDTPENRRIASDNIREVIRRANPDCKIVERSTPDE